MSFQTRVREGAERFRDLPGNKKMLLLAGLAAVASVLIALSLYSREPDYKVLFSNLTDKDGGQITAALQQMNVPYKVGASGSVEVPTVTVYDLRLKLAAQGLPKAGNVGFELMDNEKFGISQFAEQVNYQRAIEGELGRTIESINSVEAARVHLAIPKNSVFIREQQAPTASVVLTLTPGRALDEGQIAGIVYLVSSSVPELVAKNITVVDQNGNLLSSRLSDDGQSGLNQHQVKYVRDIEQTMVKRVQTILEPLVGRNNAHAEVTAEVDFSEVEKTAELYDPNSPPSQAAIRSQQTSEHMTRDQQPVGGVPGALSNQPPSAASAPINLPAGTQAGVTPTGSTASGTAAAAAATPVNSAKDTTTNYEVDKTIEHTRMPVGSVKRLSAAVVVNFKKITGANGEVKQQPLSAQEMTQINNLVKEAVGFNAKRGDSINVVNAAFADNDTQKVTVSERLTDYISSNTKDFIKQCLIALVILYLMLGVVRPVVREIMLPKPPLPEGFEASMMTLGPDADMFGGGSAAAEPLDERERIRRQYESSLEAVRALVRSDPRMAAQIIKEWVSGDE